MRKRDRADVGVNPNPAGPDVEGSGAQRIDSASEVHVEPVEDVLKTLEERQTRGRFVGNVHGTKVCISNLGWAFDEKQIRDELTQHLIGVKSITFASVRVESVILHVGYGCIEFDSIQNAVKGLIKMDTLCMDCPGLPIPRPILSYFPMWKGHPWGEADIPGYILEHGVSPHFCQRNTTEYDVALEWKRLLKCLRWSKKTVYDAFTKSIAKELIDHKRDFDLEAMKAVYRTDRRDTNARTVVCKGVSIELKDEQLRNAVEVADYCGHIRRLKCPVSGEGTGTVFIEISSPERAASFAKDMEQFLFVLGRSPRPAVVDLLDIGPPKGFEGVFDRAVESVFHVNMSCLDRSQFSRSHIVDTRSWENEKSVCSEKVRMQLNNMMSLRANWKTVSNMQQQDLHVRQKDWIERELRKLEKLERIGPRLFRDG